MGRLIKLDRPPAVVAAAAAPVAASFNVGTTGAANNITQATNFTFTIPAGVLPGDVMIVAVTCFTFTSAAPAVSTPSSGGGSWSQIGSLVDTGATSGLNVYATAWARVATAADPGSTFSISFSGTQGATNGFYWSASLGAYTGFSAGSPVGNNSSASGNNTTIGACPTVSTARSGSWGVCLCAAAVAAAGGISGSPAGLTDRARSNPGNGVDSDLADTNASAGGAGSSIGGGSFTATSAAQWAVWTVELAR